MIGKAKPATSPADAVAKLISEALIGTLQLGVAEGIALAKVYARYRDNPAQRKDAIAAFAELLAREAPDIAAQLVDALGARVGR